MNQINKTNMGDAINIMASQMSDYIIKRLSARYGFDKEEALRDGRRRIR